MVIRNEATIKDKYERISAIRQARNGKPLTIYGSTRDTNAIRVYIKKQHLAIEFHYKTISVENDVVMLKFNQPK